MVYRVFTEFFFCCSTSFFFFCLRVRNVSSGMFRRGTCYRVFTGFLSRGGGWGGSGRGANLNLNARATRRRRKRRRRDAASISRALRGRRRDAPSTDAEFFVVFASFAFVVTFTEFYRVLQRGKKSDPSAEVLKDR